MKSYQLAMESWAACLSGGNEYKKTPDTFLGTELIEIILHLNAARESNIF